MYELRPRAIIITLGNSLYRIPEVAPPTSTSLITTKKGSKLISQTRKFIFCLVHSQSKGKIITTSMTPAKHSSMQQMHTVMKEHRKQKLRPREVDVPIYPNRAHNLAFHLLGLGFWMFRVFHCFSTINMPSSLIVT